MSVRRAGKTWVGGRFVARPSMMRRADYDNVNQKSSWYQYTITYTTRSVLIGICGFLLGGNGHETFQNGTSEVLALYF